MNRPGSRMGPWLIVPLVAGGLVSALLLAALGTTLASTTGQNGGCAPTATGPAGEVADIPASLMPIYAQAAARYQLAPDGWAYLAAVNYQETDFGHNLSTSSAGAIGWMQFEPGTWRQYGVSADPTAPGAPPDPDDPWDAIFSAARYLHASGAPVDWMTALTVYRNAGWYAAQVQQRAQRYLDAATGTTVVFTSQPVSCAPVAGPTTSGTMARLLPDGTAAIPQDAPAPVQAAIAAGNRIITTAYSLERAPGMLSRVMGSYDCSGSTDFVLSNAGLSTPQVDVGDHVAGDSTLLESYGLPGAGQWITVYASPAHAFIQIAGLVLDTAWWGPVQPTIPTSGPRWQPASILTRQLADGNPWTQRHPPGL
jgi:hypothetical protein